MIKTPPRRENYLLIIDPRISFRVSRVQSGERAHGIRIRNVINQYAYFSFPVEYVCSYVACMGIRILHRQEQQVLSIWRKTGVKAELVFGDDDSFIIPTGGHLENFRRSIFAVAKSITTRRDFPSHKDNTFAIFKRGLPIHMIGWLWIGLDISRLDIKHKNAAIERLWHLLSPILLILEEIGALIQRNRSQIRGLVKKVCVFRLLFFGHINNFAPVCIPGKTDSAVRVELSVDFSGRFLSDEPCSRPNLDSVLVGLFLFVRTHNTNQIPVRRNIEFDALQFYWETRGGSSNQTINNRDICLLHRNPCLQSWKIALPCLPSNRVMGSG
eukprot:02280_1